MLGENSNPNSHGPATGDPPMQTRSAKKRSMECSADAGREAAKRGLSNLKPSVEEDDAVAAMLMTNNPFAASDNNRYLLPTSSHTIDPSCNRSSAVPSSHQNQQPHPIAPRTPDRGLVLSGHPVLGPGCHSIALLTPRTATPRSVLMTPDGRITPHIVATPATTITNTPKQHTDRGLRFFSARVSAKVEEKGCTTYHEVAEELVQELAKEPPTPATLDTDKVDHKNIRRRVYDALNVLMAIDIIRKEKKEIRWLGFPSDTSQDIKLLEAEKEVLEKRVAEKRKLLGELVQRQIALRALIARNRRNEAQMGNGQTTRLISPTTNPASSNSTNDRLYLPFILVNAPKDCRVHCEMLEDRTQYFFEFDAPFFINEDIELLKLMGLDAVTVEELLGWLPTELLPYARSSKSGQVGQDPMAAGAGPKGIKHGRANSINDINNSTAPLHGTNSAASFRRTLMSSPGRAYSSSHYYCEGSRPPPHLAPPITINHPRRLFSNTHSNFNNGPMSDIVVPSSFTNAASQGGIHSQGVNNLSKRFKETLTGSGSMGFINSAGSSPII